MMTILRKSPFLLLMLWLLAACSASPTPTSTIAPTPVASDTPLPFIPSTPITPAADRFDALPQATAPSGFPQVGFSNAHVSVTVYIGYGDAASADFYANTLTPLLDRVRNGEILLTLVPLANRGAINDLGAARAALCGSEQGAFWRFQDALFSAAQSGNADVFADSRMIELANSLAVNQTLWDECMSSNRPDEILGEAERQVSSNEIFTQMPFVTVNGASSLPDIESLNFTIDVIIQQFNQQLEEALVETTPEATEETLTLPSTMNERVPPPLIIGLPDGWEAGYDNLVLQDVDAIRTIPFAVYRGPVTGGTGNIVLLWGFPNLQLPDGIPSTVTPDLWLDGLRLLRLAVVEQGCNVGTDLQREYNIGGLTGIGTQFAAVDCPELPDTRGWFAGLRQYNLNYVFYVYTDSIDTMDAAEAELQSILNTVLFSLPQTPDPNATATPAP